MRSAAARAGTGDTNLANPHSWFPHEAGKVVEHLVGEGSPGRGRDHHRAVRVTVRLARSRIGWAHRRAWGDAWFTRGVVARRGW